MRRSAFILVLIVAACSAGPAHVTQRSLDVIGESFPNEKVEVEKVLRDIMVAAEKKDSDRLLSYIADSPKVTKFDDWEPLDRQDVATWKKAEREALSTLKSFKPTITDLKVDVFGPVAIATFVIQYDAETNTEKFSAKARSTFVFARDVSDWKVVHVHNSAFKANP